jgi:hypothetical protein
MATTAAPLIAEAGDPLTTPAPPTPPSRWTRVLVALGIGQICGTLAYAYTLGVGGNDWAQIWYGARALMKGVSPYAVVGPGRAFDWGFPLLYPLPAVVVGVPFALAPMAIAGGIFAGVSAALLALGLTRGGWNRLVVLLSAPFVIAIVYGQWSVLLTAAVILSPLGFLLTVKPTIGAALWIYRPSLWTIAGGAALVLVSIALQPSWPREWIATLSHTAHMVTPIAHAGGPLLLLALLRWRRREARLLLALACVPQTALPYAAVPLLLIPATLRESVAFVILSYVQAWLWVHLGPYPRASASIPTSVNLMVPLLYLPCLVMVLRRPNRGDVPEFVTRFLPHRVSPDGPVCSSSSSTTLPPPSSEVP